MLVVIDPPALAKAAVAPLPPAPDPVPTPAAAPILADITVGGKAIKSVALPTKQGILYMFDRVTGKPIWPFEERAVEKGDVPLMIGLVVLLVMSVGKARRRRRDREANPEVLVRTQGGVYWSVPDILDEGEEHDRLYALLVEDRAWYADYQKKTPRTIPLVRLVESRPAELSDWT